MQMNIAGNKIIIKGNVKSIKDYEDIKEALDKLAHHKYIIIELVDSISLTSSVIGYLSKLINRDKIKIELRVCDKGLFDLLDDLGLIKEFNVKRICNEY